MVIVALVCGGRLCGDCGFGVWWKCVGVIVALVCGGSVLG